MKTITSSDAENILDKAFKTYDIRGVYGESITIDLAFAAGAAFVDEVEANGKTIIIGHDMRDSSPIIVEAFIQGATMRGASVINMGLCSTDANYFASGLKNMPSVMVTASHNPAKYNGIKLCRAEAKSISSNTGLLAIKEGARKYLTEGVPAAETKGTVTYENLLEDYISFLRNLVPLENSKPLKIVVDAANGMGGFTVPAMFKGTDTTLTELPFEIIPMYFELDGNFPNHEANPLDVKNLADLRARVIAEGADLGLAFDGDADRCFVVDEKGEPVQASAVAAIIAAREIARTRQNNPEEEIKVLHSLTCSLIVPETIAAHNAEPIRVRVGHSLAKDEMARTGAIFGGEHSGHYYFKSLWGADSGMLAALHVIAEVASTGQTMSELAHKYTPYFASGEINSTVEDAKKSMQHVVDEFSTRGKIDYMDGTYISYYVNPEAFWWISLRSSGTEPLLRLNVEASSQALMEEIRDEVLQLIK